MKMLSEKEILELNPDALKEVEAALGQAEEAKTGQGSLSWHIKRLGKITGSAASRIKTTSNKIAKNSKKAELIEWLSKQPEFAMLYEAEYKKNPINSADDLKAADLRKMVDACEGEISLSAGAETFLDELIAECGYDPVNFKEQVPPWLIGVSTAATRWGHEYEPDARKLYEKQIGIAVEQKTFVQSTFSDLVGVSPDGKVRLKNGSSGAIEIKCPHNSANHACLIRKGGYDKTYIDQLVHTFLVMGVEFIDFVSYDPRQVASRKLYIYRIEREELQDEIAAYEKRLNFFLQEYAKELELQSLTIPRAEDFEGLEEEIKALAQKTGNKGVI